MENENNLFHFVISENYGKVKSVLEAGTKVNIRDKTGHTPLLHSIEVRNFDICKILLEHGADPNLYGLVQRFDKVSEIKMLSPLMLSAALNEPKILSLLLKFKANVHFKDNVGYSVLDVAAIHEAKHCIKILLESGVGMDDKMAQTMLQHMEFQDKEQLPPLHSAARDENWESFKQILDQTTDVNVTDHKRNTPLNIVVHKRNVACTELLLKKGADPAISNMGRNTPLHTAAGVHSSECIELLLQYNADVNAKGPNDFTPLHMVLATSLLPVNFMDVFFMQGCEAAANAEACTTREILNCIKILLKANANIFAKDSNGFTSLHGAAQCGPTIFAEVLGNDVNKCNSDGLAPVHIASTMSNVWTLDHIVSKGADVNTVTLSGDNPLHIACRTRTAEDTEEDHAKTDLSILHKLIQSGCKVNEQNKQGQTPLHLSIRHNLFLKFRYLLNCGVDLNLTDKDMKTPLHYAAENGELKYAKSLIDLGVKITINDKACRTPLMIAAKRCNIDLVRLLLTNNASLWDDS